MKLKISVLLTILVSISVNVFGQKPPIKTPDVPNKPADVTKLEITKNKAKTPTVKEILAKYVQAIGGRANYEKIKSRMTKATQDVPTAGIKGTIEIYAAAPNKSFTKAVIGGIGEFFEGFDGKNAWSINPLQGSRDKSGEELVQTKLRYDFYRDINLDKLYPKIELKGTEKVGANEAYVLIATPDNLPSETFYFDTKSGLLIRQDITATSPEGKTPSKNFFEDMREIDGVKIPFRMRTILPQFEVVTTLTEVKNNIVVEDAKFTKPKI